MSKTSMTSKMNKTSKMSKMSMTSKINKTSKMSKMNQTLHWPTHR
jgi:hypothetical protein